VGGDPVSSNSVTPDPAASFELHRPPFPRHSRGRSAGTSLPDERDESMFQRVARTIGRPTVGVAAVLLITAIFRHVPVANVTTVGFTFLLAILIASTVGGLATFDSDVRCSYLNFRLFLYSPSRHIEHHRHP